MIKKFFGILVCIFASLPAVAVPGRVDYIIDGDTFSCIVILDKDIEISVRVRLRNVDTPEIHGECEYERLMAQRAKEKLGELIPVGTMVDLQNIKDDKYLGRIDANVLDSQGRDVGKILVAQGLGSAYSGGHRSAWCPLK